MRKLYALLMSFALLSASAYARETSPGTNMNAGGPITWEKLFTHKNSDAFRSVQEVLSGGYILAGYQSDSSVSDTVAFAVRMDVNGDTLWTYTLDGAGKDLFYKVSETSDGGFVFCGYTTSSNSSVNENFLIVKLDMNGQQLWLKTWGGSQKDRAQDVIEASDGNIIVVGYTSSIPAQYYDAVLFKLSTIGDSLTTKLYGNTGYDDANSVKELADGGYVLGGQSGTAGNFDSYLVRVNNSGTLIWQKRFGSPGNDNIESVLVLSDGFICAGGSNLIQGGDDNGYITRTDTGGIVTWAKSIGGTQPDDIHRIEPTSDGGYIAAGTTSSFGANRPNMWMIKLDANADTMWTRTFGGDNHDHGYSIVQTLDGGYVFAGYSSSFGFRGEDAYVVKTDGNGDIFNHLTYTVVDQVVNPTSAFCGGTSTLLRILIRNFGNDTVPSVPAAAIITGSTNTSLNDIYNGAFYPLDADTLQFNTPFVTVPNGTYTFTVYTNNNNDVYPDQNTLITTVTVDGSFGPPTTSPGANCGTGTVTLAASGSGVIYWFSTASGGLPIDTGSTFTTPSLISTTTFYAQTGLNCPSSRVPAVATINNLPNIGLGNDTAIATGATIMLDAGNGFTSYAWTPGGENTQTITVAMTDTYCVTVTDTNNCTNSDCIAVNVGVGIDETGAGVYSLYPNPARDQFAIMFNNNQKAAELQITNCIGAVVKNEVMTNTNAMTANNINIGGLPAGVYIVRVKAEGRIFSQRLIIQ